MSNQGVLMKNQKNNLTLAICFAFCSSLFAEEETTRLTDAQEEIITEVVTTATETVLATINDVIQSFQEHHTITLEEAHTLLQQLESNLVNGSTFEINDKVYIINTSRADFFSDKVNVLTTVAIKVVNHIMVTISDAIQSVNHQTISQNDAIALLQACAHTLTNGSQFALNGTIYTVITTIESETKEIVALDVTNQAVTLEIVIEDTNTETVVAPEVVIEEIVLEEVTLEENRSEEDSNQ